MKRITSIAIVLAMSLFSIAASAEQPSGAQALNPAVQTAMNAATAWKQASLRLDEATRSFVMVNRRKPFNQKLAAQRYQSMLDAAEAARVSRTKAFEAGRVATEHFQAAGMNHPATHRFVALFEGAKKAFVGALDRHISVRSAVIRHYKGS